MSRWLIASEENYLKRFNDFLITKVDNITPNSIIEKFLNTNSEEEKNILAREFAKLAKTIAQEDKTFLLEVIPSMLKNINIDLVERAFSAENDDVLEIKPNDYNFVNNIMNVVKWRTPGTHAIKREHIL